MRKQTRQEREDDLRELILRLEAEGCIVENPGFATLQADGTVLVEPLPPPTQN